ncbi:MAG: hypothetical protein IPG85_08445 [Bacteroidetes bacterium]|nr:hypothetical protein [Bacteroidota bacterium]
MSTEIQYILKKVLVLMYCFIPNAFSPNGDNNNDEFKVFSTGIELIQLKCMTVGDRNYGYK